MTAAKIALLEDRGVVSVNGEDAEKFLQGLITNDMDLLGSQSAIFAGLLSPQGKILFEFFVARAAEGYLLDVAKAQAGALAQRLNMYKLRAKVDVRDAGANHVMFALWGDEAVPSGETKKTVSFEDPRSSRLGRRIAAEALIAADISPAENASTCGAADYHAHRIALGIPEGGKDYAFGEAFVHEALFDQLSGVSFAKGCYVGQEIVARMEHRGTARRRIVRVRGAGELPGMATDVKAGDVVIGAMGSHAGDNGLAMLRLDRVIEFAVKGVGLTAGGVALTPDANDVARLMSRSQAKDP